MSDLGVNFDDLRSSVDWSIGQLAKPRQNRIDAIEQYVGMHYATGGSQKRVPTNFLELATTIYTSQLVSDNPRVMVSSSVQGLKSMARNLELAINQVPDELDLSTTLRRAVMEALFCFGVVKVGISSMGVSVLGHEYGEPYVDIVSIDDYFVDMSAKSMSTVQFEGNEYWLPLEVARKMWGDGKSSEIEPDEHTITGDQGEERAEGVSTDEGADVYKDRVWMRDVWLSKQNKLVTYGVKNLKVFNIIDWDGPDHGPFHTLGYSDVPGNLLPLPPVSLWKDLHELGNSLFRKLGKQADSKKTVAVFAGGNDESVKALQAAQDGDGIHYSGGKPEALTVGGIDQATLALFLQTKDLFSYLGGNLDTLGGLAPATDTVGQDELLSQAASARLDYMRRQTNRFTKGIFRSLAWYEWTDPVRTRILDKPVKGSEFVLRVNWTPETRDGDFLDYNIDLDVFSMQDDSPAVRMQKIGTALERFIIPLLPQIEAQGGQLNFKVLIDMIARLSDIDELKELVIFGEPPETDPLQEQENSTPTTTKPTHTTRTYERVNRPGATRHGKDDAMSRILMGAGVQGSEAAALSRPTS